MSNVYLGLGSNQGDRQANLAAAIELLTQQAGSLVAASRCYETAPWGFHSPHPFLNAALCLRTALEPIPLLRLTQRIERRLGRTIKTSPGHAYTDRPIDIDILFYGDLTLTNPTLTIPHPALHLRRFVLEPLAEIAPTLRHPTLGRTVSELLDTCPE